MDALPTTDTVTILEATAAIGVHRTDRNKEWSAAALPVLALVTFRIYRAVTSISALP
jgi:hypothetical protein